MKITRSNQNFNFISILIMPLLFLLLSGSCNQPSTDQERSQTEITIRQIHRDYVEGWLANDEEKIMNLLDADPRIQPNSLRPINGKEAIRKFWFPQDSSTTVINEYSTQIISFNQLDTLATTIHTSLLDWDYQKDSIQFGRRQKGINTTIYKKQADNSWKIWRSMWTDIQSEAK